MSRFFIKQISVTGEKVLFSEVSFNDGVNIIYGPSNAGKSYIINCINFMFAGDPPFTKSSTGYDTVTMTMESDDGYAIFMTRKIIDGKNGEVGENSVEVISNYPNVESGPYSISKNEYSDLLLKLMGINEHQRFRIYVRENWYRKDAFANDIWIPHMEQLPGYNMDAFREEYLNMQILRKMLEEFRKNDNTKN